MQQIVVAIYTDGPDLRFRQSDWHYRFVKLKCLLDAALLKLPGNRPEKVEKSRESMKKRKPMFGNGIFGMLAVLQASCTG